MNISSFVVGSLVCCCVLLGCDCQKQQLNSCTQVEVCKCVFPGGDGLDLTPLTSHYIGWPTLKTKPDYSVSVNPCGSMFKNETEDCFESSVCLNVSGTLTDLGSVKESQLVWESLGRTPSITFTKVINSTTVTTTVLLKCDEAQSLPKLEFITAIRNKYTLRLTTKEACLKSTVSFSGGGGKGGAWGVFSVLMLIGLVLLLVYFVAGFLVLKFIRGAQGLEAIPNHEFWFSIPKRFKEAAVFVAGGCKRQESYDRI